MPNRSGKFYRKNEAEVMRNLGLVPTKNSGSGWIEKEDGQNETVIAQLKSTDAESIRIHQKDISILEYNASVAHKVPVFVVQFLNNNDVFIMARPCDMYDLVMGIDHGSSQRPCDDLLDEVDDTHIKNEKVTVKASRSQRDKFHKDKQKENDKRWKKK